MSDSPSKRLRMDSSGKAGTGRPAEAVMAQEQATGSPYLPMFEGVRSELDAHHDRRERVIKTSRDVTANSKKIIFALQRVRSFGSPLPAATLKITQPLEDTCMGLLKSVAPDLQGMDAWRYQRQISPGLEELMEAMIFKHYLEHQTLLDVDRARALLPDGIMLTQEDWMGGLMDSVGECMRWAITGIATSGKIPGSTDDGGAGGATIMDHVRQLRVQIENLDARGSGLERDLKKKMDTMKESVEKVEYAAYGMIVRGRERPKGWVPEQQRDEGMQAEPGR